jgi:signal transduction histidine kinase
MPRVPDTGGARPEEGLQELRAPLSSIVAYVDLLLEEDVSEREARAFLEVIRSSAVRAHAMVAERQ